jgi:hypothetical protein
MVLPDVWSGGCQERTIALEEKKFQAYRQEMFAAG